MVPEASGAGEVRDTKTRNDIRNERTVSLQVVDVPLNDVLSILAKNIPIDIKGTVALQERITVQFSNLTIEEALNRIMRGYNYVLVRSEESAKVLLVVINKAERTLQSERTAGTPTAPAVSAPGSVAPSGFPPTQAGRPGTQQAPAGKGQDAATPVTGPATAPAAAGEAAQQGSGSGPENQPPQGADRSASTPTPPVPSQPPVRENPEPVRVMTPFGERLVEPPEAGSQAPSQGARQQPVPDMTAPPGTASSTGQP